MKTLEDLADKMENEDQAKIAVNISGLELENGLAFESLNHLSVKTLEQEVETPLWVDAVDKFITALEFQNPAEEYVDLLSQEIIVDLLWVSNTSYSLARIRTIVRDYLRGKDLSELLWFVVTGEIDVEAFDELEVKVVEDE